MGPVQSDGTGSVAASMFASEYGTEGVADSLFGQETKHLSTVVSNLVIRPNIKLLEERIQKIYMDQPKSFMESVTKWDAAAFK
jgi:hypothetical protein